jgi:hypothetical protein
MKNWLKYNFQIFMTWLVYVFFKKKLSDESVKFIENHYNFKPREKKLFERIKKIQGGNK